MGYYNGIISCSSPTMGLTWTCNKKLDEFVRHPICYLKNNKGKVCRISISRGDKDREHGLIRSGYGYNIIMDRKRKGN